TGGGRGAVVRGQPLAACAHVALARSHLPGRGHLGRDDHRRGIRASGTGRAAHRPVPADGPPGLVGTGRGGGRRGLRRPPVARPGGAVTVSVAVYFAQGQWSGWLDDGGPRAYLIGSGTGVIAWLRLAVAARGIATPAGRNPSAYGQLCEMLDDLDANYRALSGE